MNIYNNIKIKKLLHFLRVLDIFIKISLNLLQDLASLNILNKRNALKTVNDPLL